MEVRTQDNIVGCAGDNVDLILEIEIADSPPMSRDSETDTKKPYLKDNKVSFLPSIELTSTQKVIELLANSDTETLRVSESCCRELSMILEKLLARYNDKKLQDFLHKHPPLQKCEHCGVISATRTSEIVAKQQRTLVRNSNSPVTRKPLKSNENSYLRSYKERKRGQQDSPEVHGTKSKNIKEEVKKIPLSMKEKTQIDRLINTSLKHPQEEISTNRKQADKRMSLLPEDFLPIVDTMKYLVRGRFATLDKKEKSLEPNFHDNLRFGARYGREKDSFALHGSRDQVLQPDLGFWLRGNSNISSVKEPHRSLDPEIMLLTEKLDNPMGKDDNENVPEDGEDGEDGNMILQEADSLENCTNRTYFSGQSNENDTVAFDATTEESLIHQWVKESSWSDVAKSNTPSDRHVSEQTNPPSQPEKYEEEMKRQEQILHNTESTSQNSTKLFVHAKGTSPIDVNESLAIRETDSAVSEKERVRLESLDGKEDLTLKNDTDCRFVKTNDTTFTVEQQLIQPESKVASLTSHSDDPIPSVSMDNGPNPETYDSMQHVKRTITYGKGKDGKDDWNSGKNAPIVPLYRKILESTEDMDWDNFQRLVENLHPDQKELWCDICRAISNEARRAASESGAKTEVCIEIDPISVANRKNSVRACGNEITFQVDMALKHSKSFLGKKLKKLRASKSRTSDKAVSCDRGRDEDKK